MLIPCLVFRCLIACFRLFTVEPFHLLAWTLPWRAQVRDPAERSPHSKVLEGASCSGLARCGGGKVGVYLCAILQSQTTLSGLCPYVYIFLHWSWEAILSKDLSSTGLLTSIDCKPSVAFSGHFWGWDALWGGLSCQGATEAFSGLLWIMGKVSTMSQIGCLMYTFLLWLTRVILRCIWFYSVFRMHAWDQDWHAAVNVVRQTVVPLFVTGKSFLSPGMPISSRWKSIQGKRAIYLARDWEARCHFQLNC